MASTLTRDPMQLIALIKHSALLIKPSLVTHFPRTATSDFKIDA